MKKLFLLLSLPFFLQACIKDTGKTQAALQNIYNAISEGNLDIANKKLASVNQLDKTPLTSDGYTKQLYGQLYILETVSLGGGKELIIYKLEEHERVRLFNKTLNSETHKARKAAGEVKSVDEENRIIVYSTRKYAFKVKENGEERYIIKPTDKAMNTFFPKNKDKVLKLVQKHMS
jgi:hypothetical protein